MDYQGDSLTLQHYPQLTTVVGIKSTTAYHAGPDVAQVFNYIDVSEGNEYVGREISSSRMAVVGKQGHIVSSKMHVRFALELRAQPHSHPRIVMVFDSFF